MESSEADFPARSPMKARNFPTGGAWYFFGTMALILVFFAADLLLPRGATPAIGYCLALVAAVGARHRGFSIGVAVSCSLLTWAGYFLEPAGAVWWMSAFDRVMVTLVLWGAFVLTTRRVEAAAAVARQTEALEKVKTELERSNGELGTFASVIAHDLRAPLNTIGLLAQMIDDRRSPTSVEERQQSIDAICNEVTHMSTLIQSLLEYGRVGSGGIRLAVCDCEEVLRSVQDNLKSELERLSGRITSGALPSISADPTLMAELFQNLIENSLKYRSDCPPEIHIAAVPCDDGYHFSVRDNGIGIPPGDPKALFEPFRQGRHGPARCGGVGLGLATCKRIVERHGGQIWAEPLPGPGSTFHFIIPEALPVTTRG
jgi:signal transduction histidine kinase